MLAVPPLPPALYRVWQVWCRISHMRPRYDGGYGPLDIDVVATFLDKTNTFVQAWEWEALALIDGCWLSSFDDRRTYPFADDPELLFDA